MVEEEKEVEDGKKEVDDGGGEGEERSLERKPSYGGRGMEKSSGFRQVWRNFKIALYHTSSFCRSELQKAI